MNMQNSYKKNHILQWRYRLQALVIQIYSSEDFMGIINKLTLAYCI
jgi:hypothetical protein